MFTKIDEINLSLCIYLYVPLHSFISLQLYQESSVIRVFVKNEIKRNEQITSESVCEEI